MKAAEIKLSQTQREQLAFLERRAFFTGEPQHGKLEFRFANRDAHRLKQRARCEAPGQLDRPALNIFAPITRGLYAIRPVKVCCPYSIFEPKRREIVPVALADNCLRRHVQCVDRERQSLGNFVSTLIAEARPVDAQTEERELLGKDEQRARMVDMVLLPRPRIQRPKTAVPRPAMGDNSLSIKTRTALPDCVLGRLAIRATHDQSLNPASHYPWLKCALMHHGVESAARAAYVEHYASV
ncbi:hypothetical protein [Pseudomonas sp. LS-2]|uniref:hypothetical protein n=1 Tax=Pseudomonas sp. LS-2 TaxID=2315859 RepID=UPI000E737B98|nr:hypothetical protein [Pseudomonas sp. LS-2]RJX82037.1 hypothetical protein D3M70_07190 [Pseudomonas sp. LS-2]